MTEIRFQLVNALLKISNKMVKFFNRVATCEPMKILFAQMVFDFSDQPLISSKEVSFNNFTKFCSISRHGSNTRNYTTLYVISYEFCSIKLSLAIWAGCESDKIRFIWISKLTKSWGSISNLCLLDDAHKFLSWQKHDIQQIRASRKY